MKKSFLGWRNSLFLIFFFLFSNECLAFGNVFGFAWSENVGWISFNSANTGAAIDYGVNIKSDGTLEGYAWSENVGWITFNEGDLAGCPQSPCKAWVDLSTKKVYGWAKVLANGGGWDGWIRLRDSNYGVWIDTSVSPHEFRNWAWSDMVVGWISFNCKDRGICNTTGQNIICDSDSDCPSGVSCVPVRSDGATACTISNYKVYTTFTFNSPPNPPASTSEEINQCAWGSTPQVAPGLTITLSWFYSDPDNDDQAEYEIFISDGANFATTTKSGSTHSGSTYSYTLNLNDFGNWKNTQCYYSIGYPPFGYGLCTSTTYYWKVRVKDSQGNWSDWSATDTFQTPSHPSPDVNFKWVPQKPTVNEVVQFCSISTGTCASTISQDEQSKCFNLAGQVLPCSSFYWTFENANPPSSNLENPTTTFTLISSNKVTLNLTDPFGYSCSATKTVTTTYPLPKWKEIAPTSFFEKTFASLTDSLKFAKIHLTNLFGKLKSKL